MAVPYGYHQVAKGESLASIARRHHITMAQLEDYNPHLNLRSPLAMGARVQVRSTSTINQVVHPRSPASDILFRALQSWGIDTRNTGAGSLAAVVDKYIKDGTFNSSTTGDQLELYLKDTAQWKQRFIGNEARVKAGLDPLAPSEYLSLERSYQDVLHNAGLPTGFYDDPADFAKFIGQNVSATELNDRAQAAATAAQNLDPQFQNMLRQYGYNLDNGQLAAYMLDPARALPTIKRQLDAASIGAAANQQGAGIGTKTAEQYLDMGLTATQVGQGYQQVNSVLPDATRLASVYGQSYNKQDATNEFLLGNQDAAKKRQTLATDEKSSFAGSGAVQNGSLAQRTGGY